MTDLLALAKSDAVVSSENAGEILRAHLRFPSATRLAAFLPQAAELGTAIIPGTPRKLPDAFSAGCAVFIDFSAQKNVLEFTAADQVISVQSGMTIDELSNILAAENLWWPVAAADGSATLAEVVSSGDGGCLEHGFGGPRDLVLGMQVALANGEVIKCGGKVVKNVTGYDLCKLFIASRSTLGLICSLHLRLFAKPEASRTLLWLAQDSQQLFAAAGKLLSSGLPLSVLELIDTRLISGFARSHPALPELAKTASRRACALLIQTHGHSSFLEEIISAVCNCLGAPGAATELTKVQADLLLSSLSSSSGRSIELNLPLSLQQKFLSEAISLQDCLWQARPGKGRLRLHLEDSASQAELLERICAWFVGRQQPVVLAYGDEHKEYRVVRHPRDEVAERLKLALKSRYDPRGCLNPLVSV